MSIFNRNKAHNTTEEHWVAVSDIMSALMLMFLLLALFFMVFVDKNKKVPKLEAVIAEQVKQLALAEKTISVKDEELAKSKELISQKEQLIKDHMKQMVDLKQQSEENLLFLSEKDSLLFNHEKNMRSLHQDIENHKQLLVEKEDLLAEQKQQLSELKKENELAKILIAEKELLIGEKEKQLSVTKDSLKTIEGMRGSNKKSLIKQQEIIDLAHQDLVLAKQQNLALKKIITESETLLANTKSKLVASEAINLNHMELIAEKEQVIQNLEKTIEQINSVADEHESVTIKRDIFNSISKEFGTDLEAWNAELRNDLTFRFNEPTILFATGKSKVSEKFQRILSNFFPRYLKIIAQPKFRDHIKEVRIEGHTSSIWGNLPKEGKEAYFKNMILSQKRARSTLFYVMSLPASDVHYPWLRQYLTANGLSSSKPVDAKGYLLTEEASDGIEHSATSQRVEFKIILEN